MFVRLYRLFIAALWLHAGEELTSWLLFVMKIVFLSLAHVVFWVIVLIPDLRRLSYFVMRNAHFF